MVSGGVDIAFFHYFWLLLCHPNFMGNQKSLAVTEKVGIFKTNKSGYYFSREMTIPKKSLCITICHAECLELFTTSTWGITKKDLTFNRYTRCLLCLTADHFSWKYPAILGSN